MMSFVEQISKLKKVREREKESKPTEDGKNREWKEIKENNEG